MKKPFFPLALILLMMCSCGADKGQRVDYPKDFASLDDVGKVKYVMGVATPDSLARFVINSALDKNPGAKIDSLAAATLYIYDNLKGEDLDAFSIEYDSYVESLPLDEKMTVYKLAGSDDAQKLGYRLGLEYLGSIRENNKTADQIERELKSFKKACGADTLMYRRFIIGFHTALEVDSSTDIPRSIYNKFKNYE